MELEGRINQKRHAMAAAKRRLVRIKVASAAASLISFGGLTAAVAAHATTISVVAASSQGNSQTASAAGVTATSATSSQPSTSRGTQSAAGATSTTTTAATPAAQIVTAQS